ncbi:MAG: hypothetical protein IPL35_07920 [Sphingobacteriales bacterium]|nr:hypothetical protein [Sphingobacteriales bacterium]
MYGQCVANAGVDKMACGMTTTLSATATSGVGTWSGTGNFSNIHSPTTTVTVLAYGSYVYTWTIQEGACTDSDQVIVTFDPPPSDPNAGPDMTVCGLTYNLQGTPLAIGTGVWSGSGVFSNASSPTSSVTVPTYGTYTFYWNASNCECPVKTDGVTITFINPIIPANAGSDQSVCGNTTTLTAQPANGGNVGTWSSSVSNVVFSDIHNPLSTVTVPSTGTYTFIWQVSGDCGMGSDQVQVTFNTAPTVTVTGDTQICTGETTQLTASGGISYTWTPSIGIVDISGSSVTLSPAQTTTYTVTVNGAGGCIVSKNVTVTVLNAPNAQVADDQVTNCSGSGVQLQASGGATYSWSPTTGLSNPNIANPIANPSATTTYTVTVTGGNGCTDTEQVTVNVSNINIDVNAGVDAMACGLQYQLSASPSTGQWSGVNTAVFSDIHDPHATVTVPLFGAYSFTWTASNGDCTASDNVVVDFGDYPTIAQAGADASAPCGSLTYTLQANTLTVGTGTWTGSAGVVFSDTHNPHATVTVPSAGIYTFTWTSENCDCPPSSDQVVINFPANTVANAGSDVSICTGGSTQLNASGGTSYSWSPSTGLSNANIANPTANPGSTTTYTVTVSNGTCSDTDEVTVTIGNSVTANAGSDVSICTGGSTQLNASGGTSYSWSPSTGLSNANIANPTANPSSTTTYTVTVSNGTCSDTDEVTVTIGNSVTANAGSDVSICTGGSTQLNASGGTSYSWSPSTGLSNANIANPTANPSSTTTYTVTVSNGTCSDTDQVTVTVGNSVTANAGSDVSICTGGSTQLNASGGISYSWSPSTGLSNANIANPTANPSSTTTYTVTVSNGTCSDTDEVTVTVGNSVTANAGSDVSICTGGSTQLNASGGTSYSWSPSTGLSNANIANPTANPGSTTTYTVTVSNGTCSDTDQVTVTIGNSVTANAGSDVSICTGGGTQLNASGGTSYSWSPSTGLSNANIANPTANPGSTTTYTVTVSNGTCSDTDEVTVTVGNSVTANAGSDVSICTGGSTQLNASGGTSYSWSPSTGLSNANIANPTANPSSTTTYTVTVSNGTCSDTDQVTVTIGNSVTANAGSDVSICTGGSTQLNASGGTSYSWSPSTGLSNANIANPTANPSSTTTYTVTVSNGTCSDTDEVTVTIGNSVTANAGSDVSICTGGSTQLNASGGTSYSWSPSTGLSNANIANPTATPSSTTTYTVTVSNGTCTDTDQVTVTIGNSVTANAGSDVSICTGGSTQLNASGGTSYSWSPSTGLSNANIANPTATPSSTTTYTVTVSNGTCSDTDQVTVTVGNSVTANAGSDVSICTGGSTQLNASGGTSYSWSPSTGLSNANIANPTATPSSTTTYTVTVSNGTCTDTDQVTVTIGNSVTANAGSDVSICTGGSTQLNASGGTSYSWSPSTGLSNANIANPTANPSSTTTYTVTIGSATCRDSE